MTTAKVMNKNFVQILSNYDIDNLTDILMTNECENPFDTGQPQVTNDLIEVANCLLTLIIDGRMQVAFSNPNNTNNNLIDQYSIARTGGNSGTNGVGIHANILIDKLIENLRMSLKQQQNDGWANGQLMSTPMTQIKHTNNSFLTNHLNHHVCSFNSFVQVILIFINFFSSSFIHFISSVYFKSLQK
jgi:hypothetical protein